MELTLLMEPTFHRAVCNEAHEQQYEASSWLIVLESMWSATEVIQLMNNARRRKLMIDCKLIYQSHVHGHRAHVKLVDNGTRDVRRHAHAKLIHNYEASSRLIVNSF